MAPSIVEVMRLLVFSFTLVTYGARAEFEPVIQTSNGALYFRNVQNGVYLEDFESKINVNLLECCSKGEETAKLVQQLVQELNYTRVKFQQHMDDANQRISELSSVVETNEGEYQAFSSEVADKLFAPTVSPSVSPTSPSVSPTKSPSTSRPTISPTTSKPTVSPTLLIPRSCRDWYIKGARVSGTYMIRSKVSDSATFSVWCDLRKDEVSSPNIYQTTGGFTLVGGISRCKRTGVLNEDVNFFRAGLGSSTLATNSLGSCQNPSGVGTVKFQSYIEDALKGGRTPLLKIEYLADDDGDRKATWFKEITSFAVYHTLFYTSNTATKACTDFEMKRFCRLTNIVRGGTTNFNGMPMQDIDGKPLGGTPHMRMNGAAASYYESICSGTGNDNRWPDSFATHWGNGANFWLY